MSMMSGAAIVMDTLQIPDSSPGNGYRKLKQKSTVPLVPAAKVKRNDNPDV